MTTNIYLFFEGRCEEAFQFYQSVLGGEFDYMGRFGDMPDPEHPIPDEHKNLVMHVSLPIGEGTVLMGSDVFPGMDQKVTPGSNFSISVHTANKEETDRVFNALAEGGAVEMKPEVTFWGSYFGTLKDRFGIQWMVSNNEEGHK